MKTKHTLGQWMKTGKSFKKITCNGKLIATVNGLTAKGYRTVASMEEESANTNLIAAAPDLLQMVHDLKKCIHRLTEDNNLSQFEKDTEAQWIGEAHELLLKANGGAYWTNANETMKYETLKIVQIPADNFTEETLALMEHYSSFVDTDTDLKETIVSIDRLADVKNDEGVSESTKKTLDALCEEIKDYDYLMLTKI